jgi:hypothetical protein
LVTESIVLSYLGGGGYDGCDCLAKDCFGGGGGGWEKITRCANQSCLSRVRALPLEGKLDWHSTSTYTVESHPGEAQRREWNKIRRNLIAGAVGLRHLMRPIWWP